MSARRERIGRRTRHRLYVLLIVALALAALVFLNLAGDLLENKFGLSADFSRSAVFTLSEDTRRMLSKLKEDVLLYAVYENDAGDATVEQMLRAYDRASEHVSSAVLDPVDDVEALLPFAKSGAAVGSGSIVVSDARRSSFIVLDYYDFYLVGSGGVTGIQGEQSISSAIRHLGNASTYRAVFMNAHTEESISSVPAYATHLMASGYGLFQSADVFSEAFGSLLNARDDVLVFLSPSGDLEAGEADALIAHVERGGSALFFLDYSRGVDGGQGISLVFDSFPNFDRVLAAAGMRLRPELVLVPPEAAALGSITRFGASPAENTWLTGGAVADGAILSECAPLSIVDAGRAQPLLKSPDASYTKRIGRDLEALDRQSGDPVGAQYVAACGRIGEGMIAVVGTSSVVKAHIAAEANRRFSIGLVGALLRDAGNPVIMPVSTQDGSLKLTSVAQQMLVIALVVGALPLAVLLAGAAALHRRRARSGRAKHD
ncbi:MAG: hypothetical protein GX592_00525 [Clostridiales bacterium]|nr:hypothetical protein [Clostridiales bacterium]